METKPCSDVSDVQENGSDNRPSNGMVGKYVIVRCHDAGVHAGVLQWHYGRECLLTDSRRLWWWKVKDDGAFLSGLATNGIDESSKVGAPITVHLTENCEIILCSPEAEKTIREIKTYEVE